MKNKNIAGFSAKLRNFMEGFADWGGGGLGDIRANPTNPKTFMYIIVLLRGNRSGWRNLNRSTRFSFGCCAQYGHPGRPAPR
jgi:hypothetical protein